MAYRLGVDVGGTFTELLLVHDESGDLHRVKTPSTPVDPSEGVLNGVRRICEESGVAPAELAYVLHGTTVATNALLESKERMGARGDVVEPVDREQVTGIVHDLVESGVESLTVSLINSYANPVH